ncbi:hypothetical protein [Maribacter sp. 2-571]|uniref:hypothetical protein n=1 Tax=Maribacter sp. 2-571 TaxID=3417569 RepID=UPI003D33F036
MNVPEINEVKKHLDKLKKSALIQNWELPYENLLTRRSAAIFFLDLADNSDLKNSKVLKELEKYDNFSYRENSEKTLSQLSLRVTFSEEEFKKNNPTPKEDKVLPKVEEGTKAKKGEPKKKATTAKASGTKVKKETAKGKSTSSASKKTSASAKKPAAAKKATKKQPASKKSSKSASEKTGKEMTSV